MNKRDYYLIEDCTHLHNPPFRSLFPIYEPDTIKCECCEKTCQLKGDNAVHVFRWHPYAPFHDFHKPKIIYCQDCLEHFGALNCPLTRGVSCYKKCKPEVLLKIEEFLAEREIFRSLVMAGSLGHTKDNPPP